MQTLCQLRAITNNYIRYLPTAIIYISTNRYFYYLPNQISPWCNRTSQLCNVAYNVLNHSMNFVINQDKPQHGILLQKKIEQLFVLEFLHFQESFTINVQPMLIQQIDEHGFGCYITGYTNDIVFWRHKNVVYAENENNMFDPKCDYLNDDGTFKHYKFYTTLFRKTIH